MSAIILLPAQLVALFPAMMVAVAVVIGAVFDVRGFRLPNWLTISMLCTGLLWQTVTHGAGGIVWSTVGLVVASFPLLLMYIRGGMGAGDVKLMAGIGSWMGAWFSLHVIIVAGVTGLLFCLVRKLVFRSRGKVMMGRLSQDAMECSSPATDTIERALRSSAGRQVLLPFGLMIAAGVYVNLLLPGLQSLMLPR